jgi:hypothetical protein
VFSNSEVVHRVNREFIPVALKAGLVNNPPSGGEGDLYAEIGRSKPAPQGICVANSAGKVLAWALSFDDEESLPQFLDYALRRFESAPDAAEPVTAERFMKFPGQPLEDVADNGRTIPIPARHADEERCPALPALASGTLVGRIIGRALDEDGQPLDATLRQEHYMEARFEAPPGVQERFIRGLNEAGAEPFDVPDAFARLLVSQAYLGQLDVNPLGGRATGGRTDSESIEFHAKRVASDKQTVTVRLTGSSDVSGGPAAPGVRTDGRQWEHRVRLEWEGYATIAGNRLSELVLLANGSERLRWGNRRWDLLDEPDVAHLMAGHPIDLDGGVLYGLLAQPCRAEEVVTAADVAAAPMAAGSGGDQLAAALGPRFLIFNEETVRELDLSDRQVAALAELRDGEQAAFDGFVQQFQQSPPDERPQQLGEYRQAATRRLDEELRELLSEQQSERLRRVELRHQGLFALADPAIARELQVTAEQRQRIAALVQEMQQQAQARQQQAAGDPRQLQRQMTALRSRQETAIGEVLNESQRARWSELTDPQE